MMYASGILVLPLWRIPRLLKKRFTLVPKQAYTNLLIEVILGNIAKARIDYPMILKSKSITLLLFFLRLGGGRGGEREGGGRGGGEGGGEREGGEGGGMNFNFDAPTSLSAKFPSFGYSLLK